MRGQIGNDSHGRPFEALDANNVTLQFFDEDAQEWTPVACTGSGSTLTCELPHFSVWALIVQTGDGSTTPPQEGTATATPATPATTPAPAATGSGVFETEGGSNMGLLLAGIAAVAILGGVGARYAVRRSRL